MPDTAPVKLLAAATAAFAEGGFAGARVDAIARRARANKALIYYYFGSKKELYQAVLRSLFSRATETIDRIETETPDPRERLFRLYSGLAAAFAANPALPQVMLREILAGGRNLTADTARMLVRVFEFVRSTLAQGEAEGLFRKSNPLAVHLTSAGTLLLYHAGAAYRARIASTVGPSHFEPPTPEELLEHLHHFLSRGLEKGRAKEPT